MVTEDNLGRPERLVFLGVPIGSFSGWETYRIGKRSTKWGSVILWGIVNERGGYVSKGPFNGLRNPLVQEGRVKTTNDPERAHIWENLRTMMDWAREAGFAITFR